MQRRDACAPGARRGVTPVAYGSRRYSKRILTLRIKGRHKTSTAAVTGNFDVRCPREDFCRQLGYVTLKCATGICGVVSPK